MLRLKLSVFALFAAVAGAGIVLSVPACANSTRVDSPAVEGGPTGEAGGGGDASDAGGGSDAPAAGPGVDCNGQRCASGQVCCAGASSGFELTCLDEADCKGDAGTPVECDGNEDCDTLNPICCATLFGGPQVAKSCPWQSAKIVCTGSCNTSIGASCANDQSKMHVCHTAADCTDGDFTSCCEYRYSAISLRFCVDDAHRQFAAQSGGAVNCDPPP